MTLKKFSHGGHFTYDVFDCVVHRLLCLGRRRARVDVLAIQCDGDAVCSGRRRWRQHSRTTQDGDL